MGLLTRFCNTVRHSNDKTSKQLRSLLLLLQNKYIFPIDKRRCDLYKNKVILAPMVRVCHLPMRLLALKYGADLVYSDEIFSNELKESKRVINDKTGTVDFRSKCGRILFQTCPEECGKVIIQLGTNNPTCALQAAKLVENDVLAVDVNLGCPTPNAKKGYFGAFLLENPKLIEEILKTLVKGLSIAVTCKIRVLPKLEDTLELARRIEGSGVTALAIHGRLQPERYRAKVRVDEIRAISDALTIPVIANGGSKEHINCRQDAERFRQVTNSSSVMIARSALVNCSVFREEGLLPPFEVLTEFIKLAAKYYGPWSSTYHCLGKMLAEINERESRITDVCSQLMTCATYGEMCALLGLQEFYENLGRDESAKHTYWKSDMECVEVKINFKRKFFKIKEASPMRLLYEYAVKNHIPHPQYHLISMSTKSLTERYSSYVDFNGKRFRAVTWQRTDRLAYQATAVVCLRELGLPDSRKLTVWNSEGDDEEDDDDSSNLSQAV